jgi:chemotaxis protein MotB
MAQARPPIIIKKKVQHGGHHGGAWKVAYADFVTAMMSLFIVLWLMNSSKQLQEAVGGYFKDPAGTAKTVGTDRRGAADNFSLTKEDMAKLKEQLQKSVSQIKDFEKLKNQIQMTVTSEGLRIELLETASGTFFDRGSPRPNKNGRELLSLLAQQLGSLPNRISIEGHTDAAPYSKGAEYGNWELSSDRANAARRLMQQSGLRQDQVSQVRGFADQKLRTLDNPLDPSNRRISVIVQYMEVSEDASPATTSPTTGKDSHDMTAANSSAAAATDSHDPPTANNTLPATKDQQDLPTATKAGPATNQPAKNAVLPPTPESQTPPSTQAVN